MGWQKLEVIVIPFHAIKIKLWLMSISFPPLIAIITNILSYYPIFSEIRSNFWWVLTICELSKILNFVLIHVDKMCWFCVWELFFPLYPCVAEKILSCITELKLGVFSLMLPGVQYNWHGWNRTTEIVCICLILSWFVLKREITKREVSVQNILKLKLHYPVRRKVLKAVYVLCMTCFS